MFLALVLVHSQGRVEERHRVVELASAESVVRAPGRNRCLLGPQGVVQRVVGVGCGRHRGHPGFGRRVLAIAHGIVDVLGLTVGPGVGNEVALGCGLGQGAGAGGQAEGAESGDQEELHVEL